MDPSTWANARSATQETLFTPHREDDSLTARALAIGRLLPPYAAVAGRTAAWIWGLDVLPPGLTEAQCGVELAVPLGRAAPRLKGCETRKADLPPSDVTEVSGIRLTTLERTALDCARWLPRMEAVAALDQFLRRGVDPMHLAERAGLLNGLRNARNLRTVLELADRAAESPGESWTRVRIIDTGLPRPRAQVPVAGPGGVPVFIDLGYEQYKVGAEYDGAEHHTALTQTAHDEARRTWLRSNKGWQIIPVTKADVLFTPRPFLEALMTELFQAGWAPTDLDLDDIMTRLTRLRRPPHPP